MVAFRTVDCLLKLEIWEQAIILCANNRCTVHKCCGGGGFVCTGAGGDRRTDRSLTQQAHMWKASRR